MNALQPTTTYQHYDNYQQQLQSNQQEQLQQHQYNYQQQLFNPDQHNNQFQLENHQPSPPPYSGPPISLGEVGTKLADKIDFEQIFDEVFQTLLFERRIPEQNGEYRRLKNAADKSYLNLLRTDFTNRLSLKLDGIQTEMEIANSSANASELYAKNVCTSDRIIAKREQLVALRKELEGLVMRGAGAGGSSFGGAGGDADRYEFSNNYPVEQQQQQQLLYQNEFAQQRQQKHVQFQSPG
ncbi:unnamed protein product [Amoebophrya sp. A120]|nr:unnamed protein product [Amoebophrya sp. A120]|eukprot:GSA120T00016148001.1